MKEQKGISGNEGLVKMDYAPTPEEEEELLRSDSL